MTDPQMSREAAWELLNEHLKTKNLLNHCLASEAIMRALAPRFDADPDSWGIAGLLHDIDLDMISGEMHTHGLVGAKLLEEKGLAPELVQAITRHNAEGLGLKRETILDHALAAAETLTGLIVATALVYPDKKLASVKLKSITKRFKEPRFAAGVNRDIVAECEAIGIDRKEFFEIGLEAMKGIAENIGL